MTWQPIETAPHNTAILVTTGEHTVAGEIAPSLVGGPIYLYPVGFDGDEWVWSFEFSELTHWMPIPPPPEAA